MIAIYCVRAEFGTYTQQFLSGGYVAIGWMPEFDLSSARSREDISPLYKQAHPNDSATS